MKNMAIKFQIQFEFENDRNIRVDLDLNKSKNSSLGNFRIKFIIFSFILPTIQFRMNLY